jgi:hypothetical protein
MGHLVTEKVALNFCCEKCDYNTSKKSSYTKHLSSRKHLLVTSCDKKVAQDYVCEYCNKEYQSRNGLWSHKKKCVIQYDRENNSTSKKVDETIIIGLMQQNHEFKQLIIEQQQEIQKQHQESQKQLIELVKNNIGTHNTNSNNRITNNFNLNLFLNETCKDAMNITDFINSLQVQFQDLEYTGENGYAAGISRIFLRELKQLDISKRPIHCSDIKREILHIKNQDKWEKERELLIKMIKQITRKNIILLADWREANPGCMEYSNKKNDQYMKINNEVLGPAKDEEELKDFNRIISSVAKATTIDKNGDVVGL